jgi:RimJ/RimL family protein N-acetyltransferase
MQIDPAQPVTLAGRHVRLEPLGHAHGAQLCEAVRDGELWNLWYTNIPRPEAMAAEIDRRLALQRAGSMLPFALTGADGPEVAGMTTFLNIDAAHRRVEIGGTWYRRSLQRSALNTECKLLMLTHAFEQWDCIAVEFRTHRFNEQSRRAIERLGAKLDGILRCHQLGRDGSLRDTCVYSIVRSEWPTVKPWLEWQLARPRA